MLVKEELESVYKEKCEGQVYFWLLLKIRRIKHRLDNKIHNTIFCILRSSKGNCLSFK